MKYDILKNKQVYAFGDSIVKGHTVPEKSFMRLLASRYGMSLTMYAVNGASVITRDSAKEAAGESTVGNYILTQVLSASDTAPDAIVFNGGTNDAYGSADAASGNYDGTYNPLGNYVNLFESIGEIQGKSAVTFDTNTFCGGLEAILYAMRKRWSGVPIVYVVTHRSGGRSWQAQCKVRELAVKICEKWGVYIADVFGESALDTRDGEQMAKYIINGAGSHPNETACERFYVPIVAEALTDALSDVVPGDVLKTVDLAVLAGQSNMSGRGNASDAVICRRGAGFEYKSVTNPRTLSPIVEPFGLYEDREGAIYDYGADGKTKRTGSMVSALVDEYHRLTKRQIVAVSASVGGTSTEQWKSLYIADAVRRLDDAKAFLKRNGIAVGRTFAVWCQGESDGDNGVTASEYIKNMRELFAKFKAHGAQKCFLIQTGHYNYAEYPEALNGLTGAEWDERYAVIRSAQAKLSRSDSDFVLAASLEGYMSEMKDRYHYKQSAYNAVGRTAGENISKYYGGINDEH